MQLGSSRAQGSRGRRKLGPADRVLTAARDFSARRANLWRDVYVEHLEVHDSGEAWADVPEGNPWPIGSSGSVCAMTGLSPVRSRGRVIESNIFKPGSTDYLRRFLSEVEAEGREAKPAR